jgi:hypothetical protein
MIKGEKSALYPDAQSERRPFLQNIAAKVE